MKKKFYLFLTLFTSATLFGNAQTLLEEDFETTSTETYSTPVTKGAGWTTVNSYSGGTLQYNWVNYYNEKGSIGGLHTAACDGPMFSSNKEGVGPREEILLSPEVDLSDTYELSFDWKVSPMASKASSLYDLQVRVVEGDDLNSAETVFSIQNQAMLKESGVLTYPVNSWDIHSSKIDLSDWKGKKVKLAFVYKMLTSVANIVYLDNIAVKKFTPVTTPLPVLSNNRYNFGQVYVGEKFYSTVFKMTNQGLNGLKITGVDLPEGVAMNIDPTTVNLDKYENIEFQLSYSASLTNPAAGNVVLHTNGGDVSIAYSASKQAVPEGFTLETFEKYFPPAGWTSSWDAASTALEGDRSAVASVSMTPQYLVSPRIDLSKGGKVTFTYHNVFNSLEGDSYQGNDISVDVSYDGGKKWTTKWTYDYQKLDFGETVTVDLGIGTDDSRVRWHNTAVTSEDGDVPETSNFYLDRIFLPNVYGAEGIPGSAYLVSPKDSITDVYTKDIVLKWGPAQFADGYKLYVGSNDEANDLIDGVDVGDVTTYTVASAEYETNYKWKVVAYNTQGNAVNVPVWHFTTQKDASTGAYPYEENFDTGKMPNGWVSTPSTTYSRKWTTNSIAHYGETGASLYTGWVETGESNSVSTQDFKLPAGKKMALSFVWGDEHPSDLVIDPTGLIKNASVKGGNGYSDVVLDIYVDGAWKQLAYLSENYFDGEHKYWVPENIDLSAYAGKTVKFRWTHHSYNSNLDQGAALDNVTISEIETDRAVFNKNSWNAGRVNYEKSINAGKIFTLLNKGSNSLKIKNIKFNTDNFVSSLMSGTEIVPGDGVQFSLQFDAKTTAAAVNDVMTVEFESGSSVSMTLTGEALAQDVYYYAFEPNPLELDWQKDFTLIDVDNSTSYNFSSWWIDFEKSGQRFAFWPGNNTKMNGIISPVSGDYALVAASTSETSTVQADNWIVSKKLTATANSSFDFYARNWESKQSVLPAPEHKISVLVSESSNTDISSFIEVLPNQEIPYLDSKEWKHYTVDLSAYAGKNIYVALRHNDESTSNVAFFDDFTLSHFTDESTDIQRINNEIDADAEVTVYNLGGAKVLSGRGVSTLSTLDKGVYVVTVKNGNTTKTLRIARK